MGVPKLWEIIRPASEQRSLVHLSIHDGFLSDKHNKRGYRIGIDASIWFFHAHSSREGENPELRMLFFRLAKFLALPLLPLFVFDGPKRPKNKRNKRIMGVQHPLTGSFKTMIHAFGFEYHHAPGEAEAELAYLNRIEVIDAVLSDDVDNFLFGATLVMRNPSATLSGNKGHVMRNADGKQDDKHVLLFSSRHILEHSDIQLSHGGFILIGLMSGGDYDTSGLTNCGIKISHGLARAKFGDSLIQIYTETPTHALPAALAEWRTSLCRYLATDPDKLIGRKNKALANSIPDSFPPIDVLEAYVRPVTSESKGEIPNFDWARQPSLKEIANRCEIHYEWGVRPLIIKRFRTVIWAGALMRVLRAAVIQGDEKEAKEARRMDAGLMYTPTNGRRTADTAVGTPSRLITQCLSRMEINSPQRGRMVDPFSDDYQSAPDDEPLLVKIHSQRTHASTDGVLEYRVEIAPAQFVRMTEAGLINIRSEDSIDVANFGKRKGQLDDDEDFGDVDEDGMGKKGKELAKPNDHMRIWVPACMLEMVQPALVEDFENIASVKDQRKREKEKRAKDKAEGKVSPKKSRAKGPVSPSKSKTKDSAMMAFLDLDNAHPEPSVPALAPKSKKASSMKKFISDGSSDEDMRPTPRAKTAGIRPLNLHLKPSHGSSASRKYDTVSETDYVSTESITEKRHRKATEGVRSPPFPASRPPVPTSVFPSKLASASAGPSMARTFSAPSGSSFPQITSNPRSISNPNPINSTARRFMFTMRPDITPEELSDSEDGLDPYSALRHGAIATTSGSSRASSGKVAVGGTREALKVPRLAGRVDMDFAEASPVRKPNQRAQDSVEDFSHLFTPSPPRQTTSAKTTITQSSITASAPTKKKKPKFVSRSDSSDEAPPHVVKAPKKSKAQRSPPRELLDIPNVSPDVDIPAKSKNIATPVPPAAEKGKRQKAKGKRKGERVAEVIEISDSSDDDPPRPKPPKANVATTLIPHRRTQGGAPSHGKSGYGKGKADVSLIDLDDSS